MGPSFMLGPGGKGSNQAVAAARAGGKVSFISKVGRDAFGEMARGLYKAEAIDTQFLFSSQSPTGAAAILVDAQRGENAILVVPGACFELSLDEMDSARQRIADSSVFLAQLELPQSVVAHGLALARSLGVTTVLNPAPALTLLPEVFANTDYITPNETEAAALTGIAVCDLTSAEHAAEEFLRMGVRNAVITLGSQGALVAGGKTRVHIPAFHAGDTLDTTGAGDSFNGAFAVALAEGADLVEAARFACAAAAVSVTRAGTATSMPSRAEIDTVLGR